LKTKVDEATYLNKSERERLFNLLVPYLDHFTDKPEKCNLMTYKFEVENPGAIVGHSQAIPFSVRKEVRGQIEQMLKDGIIEHSNSTYVNPLTVVLHEGKSPRICLDARRVNKCMVQDRAKVQPVGELLQRFHGSK
jgi:hypothetical protein